MNARKSVNAHFPFALNIFKFVHEGNGNNSDDNNNNNCSIDNKIYSRNLLTSLRTKGKH